MTATTPGYAKLSVRFIQSIRYTIQTQGVESKELQACPGLYVILGYVIPVRKATRTQGHKHGLE